MKRKKADRPAKPARSVPAPGTPGKTGCEHGSGALCAEAQADGVPCFEIGRDCETCEHAREHRD